MKKLYTFLLVALVSLVSFGAYAKNVTFKTNIANSVNLTLPPNYDLTPISGTEIKLDLGDDYGVNMNPVDGDQIEKVQNQDGQSFGLSYMSSGELKDGDIITITVKEKQVRTLTVHANPDECYLSYNYGSYNAEDQVDGAWVLTNVKDYAPINIYAKDGYGISKVVDSNNKEYDTAAPTTFYIYSSNWEGDLDLTVTTYNLDDARDKSVTIKVDGNPADVKVQRYNFSNEISLTEAETVFKFQESELPLTFSHSTYNRTLFKVELNGNPVAKTDDKYYVSPADGDVINIQTESDVDVKLNFNYSSEDIKKVISYISVNSSTVSDWNNESLTVKQGDKIYIDFNTVDFQDITATVNGTPITIGTYTAYYEFSAEDENGYTFDIAANAKKPYTVTVYAEEYDKVVLYNGSSYNLGAPIYLTQKETVLTVPVSNNYLTIKSISSDYQIALSTSGSCTASPWSAGEVSITGDDAYIEIEVEKLNRDKQMVIYLDNAEWQETYTYVLLSNFKATEFKQYLHSGYQIVNFGDFDNDLTFSFYDSNWSGPAAIYCNGEALHYLYTHNAQDGDVLKAFSSTPESYEVTYDIEENAPVSVLHDIITPIANPANHTVLENTEIRLVPAATTADASGKLVVKVNDTEVAPGEDGIYTATITADTNVKVTLDGNSGVENVAVGNNAPVDVYNLQGIEVLHQADSNQIQQLPAGIYIADGKKIVVR